MRWRQAILASALAITAAYGALYYLDASLLVAILAGAATYVAARTLIATVYRTRYWLGEGTRGHYHRTCPECHQRIHRLAGDWIMECRRCGWTAGRPILRWVTRSVPARQFRRSISWSGVTVLTIAVVAVAVAPAIGALPVSDSDATTASGGAATPVDPTPTATVTATAEPTPTSTPAVGDNYPGPPDLEAVEAETISRINKIRQQRDLQPLQQSDPLAEMAQYHANDQARNGYYAHTAPDGESVGDRFDRFAPRCRGGAENSHKGEVRSSYGIYGSTGTVNTRTISGMSEYLVQGWMNSEGHRENMLDERWSQAGIGVAVTPDGTFYATINFC